MEQVHILCSIHALYLEGNAFKWLASFIPLSFVPIITAKWIVWYWLYFYKLSNLKGMVHAKFFFESIYLCFFKLSTALDVIVHEVGDYLRVVGKYSHTSKLWLS